MFETALQLTQHCKYYLMSRVAISRLPLVVPNDTTVNTTL